jgi:tRNA (cytidine/uridine-2'-O-)-methyltransferase
MEKSFHIALHEPRIPSNTGNIIRLSANLGCPLHLIEPLGFELEEKKLRRAGLDYHDLASVNLHTDFFDFQKKHENRRVFAVTTRGKTRYDKVTYQPGDILLFGSETSGLPDQVREAIADENHIRIPMQPGCRSLNLSNAVAIVSYEAWRQLGFSGGQ